MRLNRFDLNLLRALNALLSERNISRAAERVGTSQSGMSSALAKLRDYFDDPLLVPLGRSLTLSPRGLALMERVREALLSIETALDAQPVFDPSELRREFRVVVADCFTPLVIPGMLARIRQVAPHVGIHVEPVTDASLRRLLNGDVDLCYWPYDLSLFGMRNLPPGLNVAQLGPARWVCITARSRHDLGELLSLDRYKTLPHVVPRPSLSAENVQAVWRRLLGIDLDIIASTQSVLDLPPIVAASDLAATVPECVLKLISPSLDLQWHIAPLPIASPQNVIVWHRRHDTDAGQIWLRSLLRNAEVSEAEEFVRLAQCI